MYDTGLIISKELDSVGCYCINFCDHSVFMRSSLPDAVIIPYRIMNCLIRAKGKLCY